MQHARPASFDVTFAAILAIAVPMSLAYLSTPLIGITDTAVIGQLGDAALIGAVALGALLVDVVGTTLNFLRSGTTGLVAQAMGRGDREAEAVALLRALLVALALGGGTLLLTEPILAVFLATMGPSDAVAGAAAAYVRVRIWGMPLMFANYAILGWLLGLGRARAGLALQIVLGAANIAASVGFVLGLSMGVVGVAAASVLAEGLALAAGSVLVARALGRHRRPTLAAVLEWAGFRRMLGVNRDILIRSMVLIGVFAFISAAGARLGDLTLAANAILLNLFLLGGYLLDGLAAAAEQLGGRAIGARDRAAFTATVRLTVLAGLVLAAGVCATALAGGGVYVGFMTSAADVRAESLRYYPWAAATPLLGALAFVMDGLFIGATWTAAMRNMMVLSALLFLGVWALAAPLFGNHGLWLALAVFLLARGLTLWACVPAMVRRTFVAAAPAASAPVASFTPPRA